MVPQSELEKQIGQRVLAAVQVLLESHQVGNNTRAQLKANLEIAGSPQPVDVEIMVSVWPSGGIPEGDPTERMNAPSARIPAGSVPVVGIDPEDEDDEDRPDSDLDSLVKGL